MFHVALALDRNSDSDVVVEIRTTRAASTRAAWRTLYEDLRDAPWVTDRRDLGGGSESIGVEFFSIQIKQSRHPSGEARVALPADPERTGLNRANATSAPKTPRELGGQ